LEKDIGRTENSTPRLHEEEYERYGSKIHNDELQ
jgi:hypothetical protein